jgi:2-hydroxymuconate-semialdehyde hydrolase
MFRKRWETLDPLLVGTSIHSRPMNVSYKPPWRAMTGDVLRIPIGGGAVHVDRYGEGGEPFLLVHGFATSSFLWREVATALATAGHTAYAIDLLGYGESDRPVEGDFSIAAQAEIVERAMRGLRIESATVAGLDIGGGVALRLAVNHPARVDRLALINSVAFEECPGREVRLVQRGTVRFSLRIARSVLGAAPMLRPVLEGAVANAEHMPPALVARYVAPFAGADGVAHLLHLARVLSADDTRHLDLSTVRCPTSIVWGEEEPFLESGLPERLQAAIPGATLTRLRGVSRLVPEEAPDTLARLLLELVER